MQIFMGIEQKRTYYQIITSAEVLADDKHNNNTVTEHLMTRLFSEYSQ